MPIVSWSWSRSGRAGATVTGAKTCRTTRPTCCGSCADRSQNSTWSTRYLSKAPGFGPSAVSSLQLPHQLGVRESAADQRSVHGGGIVDPHGLTGQVEPIADRFLQLPAIFETGTRCVKGIRAEGKRISAPTRKSDLGGGDVVAEQLPGRPVARQTSTHWGSRTPRAGHDGRR